MLIHAIKDNFAEIIDLLSQLDNNYYTKCHSELSQATIGEHTRHIIEMYLTLINNYDTGLINYDKRERNIKIQTNINYAIKTLQEIALNIEKNNKELIIELQIDCTNHKINSNYERELLYNLEHSIHHQALIKVAMQKNTIVKLPENFGVAKSTIEYRKQCAQ